MDNILVSCFVARIAYAFRRMYGMSIFSRIVNAIKEAYAKSNTKHILCSFLSIPSTLVYSRYYRILNGFNLSLLAFGNRFQTIADESIAFRCCRAFRDSNFVARSAIFSWFRRTGVRGLLIIAFGMYLPIDYTIREVLGIESLGAIWDEAFMLFCVAYIIWRLIFTRREHVKPRATPVDGPLMVFISVALVLMVVVSPAASVAFAGFRAVCQFMLWFFVLTRLIENDRDLKTFYFTICTMAVAVGLHGIYQYIICAEMPAKWVASAESGMRTRVYSITGSPNIMGALMVMTAPMLAALAYYLKPIWLKCLMWACTGILCLAVLFTFSRGAWFGLVVAVVIFCLCVDPKLLVVVAIGVMGLLFFVPEISNRIMFLFTSDFANANAKGGRGQRWATGFVLLGTNPLFGFGLGRFGGAIAMQNQVIENLDYFYMDNYYMKTLVEMGYVGIIAYAFLLLSNIFASIRGMFKTRRDKLSLLSVGMFSGMLGVLTHSFFENIFEVPYMNAYFWGLAAAIMYISYLRRKKNVTA
ncbi:MAG: O-antigen ligase family protein [Clostridia bacterium]